MSNLPVGTQVVCNYRVASANQYWMDNCWIGEIVEPDSAPYRGSYMSDSEYCAEYHKSVVRYHSAWRDETFTQKDSDDSLIPVAELVGAILHLVGAILH